MGSVYWRPRTSAFLCRTWLRLRFCFARSDLTWLLNSTLSVSRPVLRHPAQRHHSFRIAGSFLSALRFPRVRLRSLLN